MPKFRVLSLNKSYGRQTRGVVPNKLGRLRGSDKQSGGSDIGVRIIGRRGR